MQESIEPPADVAVEPVPPLDLEDGEDLVLVERIAASAGAWFGGLMMRCAPPSGPFFTSDGRLAVHSARFRPPLVS